jgi:hypothetical protein
LVVPEATSQFTSITQKKGSMESPSNISQTNDQLLGRQGRDLAIAARGAMGRKSVALEGGKQQKFSFSL